jgi:hypothetical protein
MTVTIPGTYNSTDINSEGGILFGVPIQYTGLRIIANNHNFIGASYAPAVGTYVNAHGVGTQATSGSTFHNITGITVPAQVGGRGLTCKFEAQNTSSVSQTIRLKCGVGTGATVTIPGSSGFAPYTATISATPTALAVCALQCNSSTETAHDTVQVRSAVWSWTPQTGTISDSPTAEGFVWGQTGDHLSTEPLTVEQYNRFRGGPRTMFDGFPQTASSFVSSWYNPDNTNKVSRTLMGHLPILKRRNKLQVRFDALAQGQLLEIFVPAAQSGAAGTYYSITPGISTSTTVYTVDPAGLTPASSATVDFTNHPLLTVCSVYLTSPNTGTQARVFSIQAVLV